MNIVNICDALEITYDQYMEWPNWFVDLKIGKMSAKAEEDKRKKTKP